MTTNPFKDEYTKRTNTELLEIIGNPGNYQPLAVQSAQEVLDGRSLTVKELDDLKTEIEVSKKEALHQEEKLRNAGNKVKLVGLSIHEAIHPIVPAGPMNNKFINAISLFFSGLFIYIFIDGFSMLKFVLTSPSAKWYMSVFIEFLPLVLLPIATISFWLRRKTGWALLAAYSTYTALSVLFSFIIGMRTRPSNIPVLDVFTHDLHVATVGQILFSAGILALLCKQSIRGTYNISTKYMFIVIGIATVLTTIQWWSLLSSIWY